MKKNEEHIVIIEEPGSKYITHITPASGTAVNITKAIFKFMQEDEIDTSNIKVVGCDGTNVNTGTATGGVIKHIEEKLGRPVHWSVCLLHLNELLFQKIFQKIDGSTSGPKHWSGPIGKQLENCENLPFLRNFRRIYSPLPLLSDKEKSDLSTDQNLLYRMCEAINAGTIDDNLGNRKPGPMSHARWLTAALRVLFLYVTTPNPTEGLRVIATFTVKVYAILWFSIRFKNSIDEGPKHLFKMISLTRYLSDEFRSGIEQTIQRNGYFAHQENILLAMTCDENDDIKQLAYRRMIRGRKDEEKRKLNFTFRTFKVPQINFNANNYTDMINWSSVDCCCPPLLKYTVNEMELFIKEKSYPSGPLHNFSGYPCHNQAVERGVKLVTEASKCKYGFSERDGFIRSRTNSRASRRYFDCKKQFFESGQ